MHSTLVRAQNVFGFFTTVAFTVAGVIAVSVLLAPQTPSASLKLRNVQVVKGRPHYYSTKKEEYAHVKFDLDADLTSLFNWNTKQVFLYITATYPPDAAHPDEPASESVIWDAIIPSAAAPWHHNQYIHPIPSSGSSGSPRNKKKSKASLPYPPGKQAGIIKLDNQRPKYQITDHTGLIANRTDAVLELKWNIQPWVGALVWKNQEEVGRWAKLKGGKSKKFDFPELKGSTKNADLKTERGGEGNRGKPA